MEKINKKTLIAGGICFGLCALAMLFCLVIFQICNLKKIQSEEKILNAQLEKIKTEKNEKQEAIKILENNSFIEQYALYSLGLGKEGTFKFVAKNEER